MKNTGECKPPLTYNVQLIVNNNDVQYDVREWGWKIFEAFEEHTKLPNGGYAALRDVTVVPPPQDNRMDTFFLVS